MDSGQPHLVFPQVLIMFGIQSSFTRMDFKHWPLSRKFNSVRNSEG